MKIQIVKNAPRWMREMGEELRRLRSSIGISQGELAKRLGISRFALNRYESGKAAPSIEKLARICEILGKVQFEVEGHRFEVGSNNGPRRPRAVPKQLRLRLGIVCATDDATIVIPSTKRGRRLDVEVLSA